MSSEAPVRGDGRARHATRDHVPSHAERPERRAAGAPCGATVGAESARTRFRVSTLGPSVSHGPVARPDACPRRWPRRRRNACRCGGPAEEALRNDAPCVHRRIACRLRRRWHDVVHDCQVRHAALLEVRSFWIPQAVRHLQRRPLAVSTRHTFERAQRLGVPEPEWTLRGHSSRVAAPKCATAPRPKRAPVDVWLLRLARLSIVVQSSTARRRDAACCGGRPASTRSPKPLPGHTLSKCRQESLVDLC